MKFIRILNDTPYYINDTTELGFSIENPMAIPDEYLAKQEFVILRTCFGFGDWGIITSLPRKLKIKYPNCKIYLPSIQLLNKIFGNRGLFDNTYKLVLSLFNNNPYIDGYVDSVNGDIFHDHYRIYDPHNLNEPLMKQILRFWQINDFTDIQPELYFSKEEIELGDRKSVV